MLDIEKIPYDETDIELFTVTYKSEDHKVKACYVVPMGQDDYPPLLYCRGGLRQVGKVKPSQMAELARHGYAVLAPHYRGNEGGEGRDEFGGADRHDVFHAAAIFHQLPRVKRQPIACLGFSRGAFMALLAAAHCENIGPVAVWNGVSDLLLTYEERTDMRRMLRRVVGHPKKQKEQYIQRSPIFWADSIRSPILIVHGTEDENVSVEHARRLATASREGKIQHQLALFEGMGHHFSEQERQQALELIFQWFATSNHPKEEEHDEGFQETGDQ